MTAIVWKGVETASSESCRIEEGPHGVLVESTIRGGAAACSYTLRATEDWEFTGIVVRAGGRELEVRRTDRGWEIAGETRSDLRDAREVDISASPLSNTLPSVGCDSMSVKAPTSSLPTFGSPSSRSRQTRSATRGSARTSTSTSRATRTSADRSRWTGMAWSSNIRACSREQRTSRLWRRSSYCPRRDCSRSRSSSRRTAMLRRNMRSSSRHEAPST